MKNPETYCFWSKKEKACDEWNSCQEPEESKSVCYNCGWLKKNHKKGNTKMKSWQEDVETLFQEVDKFPLELRIAYKLHSEGVTIERIRDIWKTKSITFPEPIINKVYNYMRDLEQGFFKKVTFLKRLKQLAKKL